MRALRDFISQNFCVVKNSLRVATENIFMCRKKCEKKSFCIKIYFPSQKWEKKVFLNPFELCRIG